MLVESESIVSPIISLFVLTRLSVLQELSRANQKS